MKGGDHRSALFRATYSVLSSREEELLHLLATSPDGGKAIARKMNCTLATIRVHSKSIFRKLNLRNRTDLVQWYTAQLPSPWAIPHVLPDDQPAFPAHHY